MYNPNPYEQGTYTLTSTPQCDTHITVTKGGATSVAAPACGPSVSSIAPVGSPLTNATGMSFTATFSEAVSGVDFADFTLTATGGVTGAIGTPTTTTGTPATDNIVWTVPVTAISGTGSLRLDLNASGTGIAATAAGAAILGGFASGTAHTVDTNAPAAPVVATVATGYKKQNDTIDFTVTYAEIVNVAGGTPRLPVKIGASGSTTTAYATYLSGTGTTALTFRYTVQAADTDADGLELASPIDLNGATLKDGGGNDATLTFTAPDVTAIKLDTTLPVIHATTPIAASDPDTTNTYTANDVITLKFAEPVLAANIIAANITPGAGTLGTTPTVAAVTLSGGYADTYTITLGASPTIVANSTLTIALANVVDRAGNVAAGDAVFTVPGLITAPGAPTIGTATAGNGSVTVAFTPPGSDGGAAVNEYTASCATASQFASAYTWTASQTGATSPITVSGLTNGTAYKCLVKASNATAGYGSYSGASNSVTPTAPAAPAPSGGSYTPPPTNILPTGGGTATLTGGQDVEVSENGKDGTTINLPPPSTGSNSVSVTLPGTGKVGVSSDSSDTKLGVTHVTLPGTTTSVSTVTVDKGSASFTATQSGQAMAGLKNGIIVVSGSKDSQVTVDATGANAKIGVKSSDTIIVPTGAVGVSGTSVDLPPPTTSGDAASTINLNIGGKELTIQSSQPNTTMTFKVVDIGGVKTPVVEVTGSAQVTSSGDSQPIVSVGGNVIRTGKSGGSSKVCNTIVQASSDASSDVVHVVTCYIVLDAGTFSAIGGGSGNGFAAIKDGIVWAGETAEFDKSGIVTSAYLGSRPGDTSAVGDDMVPGGAKFAAGGYQVGAFIPRISGTPLPLNSAKLDESIFAVIGKTLGVTTQPAIPVQSAQGVLNFTFVGNIAGQSVQNPQVNYTINADTASVIPSRRIFVDTSRADGVSISAEGEVSVATGGLVTTFAPSVADPKAFAEKINQLLPGSTSILRWNGTWQVTAADGTSYVGRPQWSHWVAAPGAATFSTTPDGNLLYSDNPEKLSCPQITQISAD